MCRSRRPSGGLELEPAAGLTLALTLTLALILTTTLTLKTPDFFNPQVPVIRDKG